MMSQSLESLTRLMQTLQERAEKRPAGSYTTKLMEGGASKIAKLAEHTKVPVREGLITPGELLRSDALDPQIA